MPAKFWNDPEPSSKVLFFPQFRLTNRLKRLGYVVEESNEQYFVFERRASDTPLAYYSRYNVGSSVPVLYYPTLHLYSDKKDLREAALRFTKLQDDTSSTPLKVSRDPSGKISNRELASSQ